MKVVCISLALALLIQPTRADYFVAGIGATACGKIAQDYRQYPTHIGTAMMTWAQGFMSGANICSLEHGQYRDLQAMTVEAQEQSLRNYCDQHPMAELAEAVIVLYGKLPLKKHTPPASTSH